MKVIDRLEELPHNCPHPVATIGNFDGMHLGHRQVMLHLVRRAGEIGGTATVVTFHPHPLALLAPDNAPRQIQTLNQKLVRMRALGVCLVIVIPFTRELAQTPAREFASEILWRRLGIEDIYVGPNFAFGHRREGSYNLLKEVGQEKGFFVGKMHQVQFRGTRVSSTSIRQALFSGQVALARRLLGRPYAMEGDVVHGAAIGGRLRIPTANLHTDNELFPRNGVYVTMLTVDGLRRRSVTNIGIRPTITGTQAPLQPTIETHILDFEETIYGKRIAIEFLSRLRDEQRFPDKEALVARIARDVARARRYFDRLEQDAPELVNPLLVVDE